MSLFTNPPFSDLSSLLSIVRAGEILYGSSSPDPNRGWTSPTYGVKIPALSLALVVEADSEIIFTSAFRFPPVA